MHAYTLTHMINDALIQTHLRFALSHAINAHVDDTRLVQGGQGLSKGVPKFLYSFYVEPLPTKHGNYLVITTPRLQRVWWKPAKIRDVEGAQYVTTVRAFCNKVYHTGTNPHCVCMFIKCA